MKRGTILFLALVSLCFLGSCTTIMRSPEQIGLQAGEIILTFDDGPYHRPEVDLALLDVLDEQEVTAAFAIVGRKMTGREDTLRQIHGRGHVLAFHSWNHEFWIFKSFSTVQAEIRRFEADLGTLLGETYRVRFVRPPMGILGSGLRRDLEAAGYRILDVTHNPTDTFVDSREAPGYLQGITRRIHRDGAALLVFHNGMELWFDPREEDYHNPESSANRQWLVDLLPGFIQSLREEGYRFVAPR